MLSFHYGWTYQTPARSFIFENRGVGTSVGRRGNPDLEPETNIAYQAGMQHLFSRDVSGQFSVFFKDIYGLITTRQERDEFGNLVNVFYNGDYASSRGFEASLTKSFSHKFSAEVNYTYSLATGVASDPEPGAAVLQRRPALPADLGAAARLGSAPHAERLVDRSRPGQVGIPHAVDLRLGLPVHADVPQRPAPRSRLDELAPAAVELEPDDRRRQVLRIWGQNVTLFFDARNVLNAKNIDSIDQGSFPNPFVDTVGRTTT